ncbi:MAG: tetratricopeptide repeat protein [Gammaproteobacteria bacterium]
MATTSPYVREATAENFTALVLENSDKGPVVVNYWSPSAGPCMTLLPRLTRLTDEFAGRFLLVTLNTDEFGALARDQGINSIPTLKVYREGKVVDTLHGAGSEASLRQFIGRHVPRAATQLHGAALEAYQRGELDRAVALAAEAALARPDQPQIPMDLAKLLMLSGRFQQADELLRCVPPAVREHRELRNLAAHLGFIRASQGAPPIGALESAVAHDPSDVDSRFQLAAAKVVRDDYEGAIVQLLEILKLDPTYRNDIGRHSLLALFDMLGDDDERVKRYRPLLADALH